MSVESAPDKNEFSQIDADEIVRAAVLKGTCPHCDVDVDEKHSNDHLGFCSESCLHDFQTHYSMDARRPFLHASDERKHDQYLTEQAQNLGISADRYRYLHDEQKLEPSQITEFIESERERKAA